MSEHASREAGDATTPAAPEAAPSRGLGATLPTSSSSSLLSSSNPHAETSSASSTTSAGPSPALMSTPGPDPPHEAHEDRGIDDEAPSNSAAYPFSADPYPQDEEAIKRHQARSAEREAEYQARQDAARLRDHHDGDVASPPLPQLPADEDGHTDAGGQLKSRAQQPQQQRVYQRPARDAIQIVDALKTSEGASTPYIVYCIRFE
ncbi:hypothetical protein JCM3774_003520, partial [Rhodotorula dairenensis]